MDWRKKRDTFGGYQISLPTMVSLMFSRLDKNGDRTLSAEELGLDVVDNGRPAPKQARLLKGMDYLWFSHSLYINQDWFCIPL